MNLALPLFLAAAAAADPTAEQRAREILAQAREALGAAKRPAAVKALSLEAELRRVQPVEGGEARDMSGELTVDALLPDRYLKIETLSPMPGAPAFGVGTGLDAGQAWRAPVGSGGGPHLVVRVADGEGPGAAESLLRRTRAEMARLALLALASAPEESGLTFTHAGEAEAPEGRADRIDVSDGQGPVGTLFVDQKTHRPLLFSFKARAPRIQMMRAMSHDAAHARAAAEQRAAAATAAPEVEARLYVSDWKAVDGLLLPHHVSQSIEGGASEEWTIKKWKLDPAFKPGHFKKQ
jgi:hypothetical protein